MSTKKYLKDALKKNKFILGIFNLLRLALGINTPSKLFNTLAQQGLAPEQVDGYVRRHKEPYVRRFLTLNLEKLNKLIKDHDRVLDIGCGTGRYLNEISTSHAVELYGIDISQTTIENYTKNNCSGATLMAVDFSKRNPFTHLNFNLVYSITVLEYIPFLRVVKFFDNVAHSLSKGGIFYLQFPHGNHLLDILSSHQYHKYPVKFVRKKLLGAGFNIIEAGFLDANNQQEYGYYFVCVKK